ncbi:MAG TPA: PAS domain S-box protein [Thermodesulfovibrionales bacterium]|nr:PAS domain S-box protein [Thermodesulfovibrionales bacterium]
MEEPYKAKEELVRELAEMRTRLEKLEECRGEFRSVQERYEKLLEAAPDAMIFVDGNFEIVLVNAQMEKLFGYTQEELTGRDIHTLIPERFRSRHKKLIADYFSNPRVRMMGSNLKIYALRKDGTEFQADISLSPLRTDEGLLVTGAIRDITERTKVQEKIERNYHIQRVISTVLKISLEPISLDEQMNRALDLILSVPHLALRSKGSIFLVEDSSRELVLKAERGMTEQEQTVCRKVPFDKCLCGRSASTCEVLFADCVDDRHEIRFEGMFPHGHYCVPIASGGRALGLISVYVNEGHERAVDEEEFLTAVANTLAGVIERRLAESEKLRLREELAQNEKLAALGRISANVAHEIRNPLTSVGGFARRLQKRISEGTKEREYADSIVSEVDSLERILKDVLTYARVAVPRMEGHRIEEVIGDVLMIYGEIFRERAINIQKSFGNVPEARIDKDQVKEAIINLVSNALDSMQDGGTLTITTSLASVKEVPHVVVGIGDSGGGIPDETLDRIFEPFFTTKIAKKGVGLGLPITKKIMEDHGGFVTVESTVGKGSLFSLYFPLGMKSGNTSHHSPREISMKG